MYTYIFKSWFTLVSCDGSESLWTKWYSFLFLILGSVLARLCSTFHMMLRSVSVISSAWTCLCSSYHRFGSRGPLSYAALWCLSTLPLGKHHSGISHFMVSITHKNPPASFLSVVNWLHSVTQFSAKSDTHSFQTSQAHELTLLWELPHSPLLKTWWAGWNISHWRYWCKVSSHFDEANVILAQGTQLKDVTAKGQSFIVLFTW